VINGSKIITEGEIVEFSIPANNCSKYTWSYPDDAIVEGNENSNSIRLKPGKREGMLSVLEYDINGCYFRYPSIQLKFKKD
jgi:hypothetical protein